MMHGGFHGAWRGQRETRRVRVTRAMLLRILSYFHPYWREGLVVLVTVVIISVTGLVPPLVVRAIIDVAIRKGDFTRLVFLGTIGMVGAPLIGGLVSVLQTYLNAKISQKVMFDLRNDLYQHIQSLSLSFFTRVKTGEIMSRLNNDVSGISQVVGDTITQNVTYVLVMLTTIVLMMDLNWRLALLSLALVPIAIISARRVGNRRFDLQLEAQRKQGDLSAIMQETLNISGFLLMKSFVREMYERFRFLDKNRELMDVQIQANLLGRWLRMLLQVLSAVGPASIYIAGGYLVIHHQISLGTIVAFVALLDRLYTPMSNLVNFHLQLMGSFALFDRIFEYLDTQPEIADRPDALVLPSPSRGQITFRDVRLDYVPDRSALADINFAVKPGQLVALVGPSGAGKTSITYLIPRFYEATSGSVLIDGHDVRSITMESLRSQIGLVTQETYLFNATVRENLRYARRDATDEEIEQACRVARFEDVVAGLPDGLDTPVGERGYRLSGGEKQRLAIARVLLKDPRILILDEATSSLDSHTEALIQEALEPLMKGRTTIAIAHRLSTVLAADKLLVLDHGHMVEEGTHRELLAKGGLYAQLYEIQFKPQLTGSWPAEDEVFEEGPVLIASKNGESEADMDPFEPFAAPA